MSNYAISVYESNPSNLPGDECYSLAQSSRRLECGCRVLNDMVNDICPITGKRTRVASGYTRLYGDLLMFTITHKLEHWTENKWEGFIEDQFLEQTYKMTLIRSIELSKFIHLRGSVPTDAFQFAS